MSDTFRNARHRSPPIALLDPMSKQRPWRRRRVGLAVSGVVVFTLVAVVADVLVASSGRREEAASGGSGAHVYSVRSPRPGWPAPPLELPSATGGSYDLASFRGKERVLLFFQAGLRCEPCWAELRAMARDSAFAGLPLGSVVSITTEPLRILERNISAERISYPVLADSTRAVSHAYNTLVPGPVGGGRDGQTFILVGRDGRIVWRADYGPASSVRLIVPVAVLVRELRKAIEGTS